MPLYWDTPDQDFDSGLTWDAGDGPSPGNVGTFLDRITSEHNQRPKFIAWLTALLQPMADNIALLAAIPALFDIDLAVGSQLDIIGQWVGVSRNLTVPITGVFFTFDTGPGFNVGALRGAFSPTNSIVVLPDAQYRTLLKARIAQNHWDGTTQGAFAAYNDAIFGPLGYTTQITDYQDMSFDLTITGPTPDAITRALFTQGYLTLKPEGVRVRNYIIA